MIQLLNGFGELSKNGVIHGHIRPDIIFVKEEKLKIGDFGYVNNSKLDNLMSTIEFSGYLPPQIMNEMKYSYKCDIWSLGLIVYEILTG